MASDHRPPDGSVGVTRLEPIPERAVETRLRNELERTWHVPTGIIGWFSVTDHRTIGKRYVATAFVFFVLGGILAALMR
jgi:cytochrome c oxidase subunit 1